MSNGIVEHWDLKIKFTHKSDLALKVAKKTNLIFGSWVDRLDPSFFFGFFFFFHQICLAKRQNLSNPRLLTKSLLPLGSLELKQFRRMSVSVVVKTCYSYNYMNSYNFYMLNVCIKPFYIYLQVNTLQLFIHFRHFF